VPPAPVLTALVLRALVLLAQVPPALVLLALVLPAQVLPALVLQALMLLALVFLALVLLLQIQGRNITSTSAKNTWLEVEFPVLVAPSAMIRYMSNGHSGTVFRVLCNKISTGRGKLAPIDWHDWHVFATLCGLGEQNSGVLCA